MHQASIPARRMGPKPGGLFDTGTTGVSKAKLGPRLTSVDSVDFSFADEALDMYATLQTGADISAVDNGLSLLRTPSNVSDLLSLDGDLDFSDNADFCEVFTDLSQILQEEGQNDMGVAMDILSDPLPTAGADEPVSSAGRRTVKRTASQAALPVVDATPLTNPDHCDYTAKCTKRRKVIAKPDDIELLSDAESCASSTSPALSKKEKYAERRRKNNIASRRSRETRKQKHTSLELKAIELEKENEALKLKVDQLEMLAKEMKDVLVQKLAHGK